MGAKTFDKKCYKLAETFLEDEAWFKVKPFDERDWFVRDLASEIQETIEDRIQSYRETVR